MTGEADARTDWLRAEARLADGARALGLDVPDAARSRLMTYLEILARWNRVFNLTAVRDPEEMVVRHLLDSLAIGPYLPPGPLLDVGSGAGLPGVPLALIEPARPVTLLDRSRKRIDFLTEICARVGLAHVQLVGRRVEDYRPDHTYAAVTARAFAALPDMLAAAGHLLAGEGVLLAMKGAFPAEEIAALPAPFAVRAVHALDVPGLAAKRHLVVLGRAA